jgi:hypothetical protein
MYQQRGYIQLLCLEVGIIYFKGSVHFLYLRSIRIVCDIVLIQGKIIKCTKEKLGCLVVMSS